MNAAIGIFAPFITASPNMTPERLIVEPIEISIPSRPLIITRASPNDKRVSVAPNCVTCKRLFMLKKYGLIQDKIIISITNSKSRNFVLLFAMEKASFFILLPPLLSYQTSDFLSQRQKGQKEQSMSR